MCKLVRDKIPEIIEASGKTPLFYLSRGKEDLWPWLLDKLIEEACEVDKLTMDQTQEITEELADVLEVVYAMCDHIDISFASVQETRRQKKMDRGGFSKGIILTGVEDG